MHLRSLGTCLYYEQHKWLENIIEAVTDENSLNTHC